MGRITGRDKLKKRLRALTGQRARDHLGAVLFQGAESIAVEAQISISRGSVSGKEHKPAPVGQAPNYDTGVLSDSIEALDIDTLEKSVVVGAEYGSSLEFGTSKMGARPFLRPARNKLTKKIRKNFANAVDRVARGGFD
ncbi:MAG: HK97 gp10 family phage protein [Sphingopyxis sp.]|uniref:HK97-gp10 family putative phage morphogenesis protein n=1 Tax=Sphingopyxis sp. TaxID=1908224 RepID=UPI001A61122D|nr:HK97-gp10 family putative phage morphogenesis protein [Sphingopyxis sp.]MBL9067816.1 HK97 gp10 family phage protein [Sphingopyxis sp.]